MSTKKVKYATALLAMMSSLTYSGLLSAQTAIKTALSSEAQQVKVINYMLSLVDLSKTVPKQQQLNYCTLNYQTKDNAYLSQVQFNQQPVKFVKVKDVSQVNGQCHTLHVTNANLADHGLLLEMFENKSILLISEGPDFARMGGHISLFKLKDKHAFTFNIPSLEMSGFDVNLGNPAQLIVEPYPNEF